MITVIIYGLDDFIVGHLSKDLTSSLASIYEVDEDEINFIAPNNMFFHKGVEQTSWNILIHVHAPLKLQVLQDQVANYLLESIGDIAINKAVEFYYYSQDNRYTKKNEEYPLYITEDNIVQSESDDYFDEDMEEGEGEDQIYTGDMFGDMPK